MIFYTSITLKDLPWTDMNDGRTDGRARILYALARAARNYNAFPKFSFGKQYAVPHLAHRNH